MSFRLTQPTRTMRSWILVALGLLVASGVAAQDADPFTSTGREMSRADLETYLLALEEAATSDQYGESLREQARARAELIRQRLVRGDYRVGDRIQVQVAGENWNSASDGAVAVPVAPVAGGAAVPTGRGSVGATFAVQAGPSVKFPSIPTISLEGVLRSELESYLTQEIGRYIREPEVTAQSLIRVSIFGAVGSPGFYYPAAEQNVGDLIMLAGGPASDAKMGEIQVRRGNDMLWSGDELQAVMAEGRTLDQMNLQAGDIIEVPQETGTAIWLEIGRFALMLGSGLLLGVGVF